ncbi:hypothetical protein D6C89_07585 [Aureobasidium pullulans]|nr:hypothetical protein D6C89_07585 [Aureobasidium pullulans]
MSAVHTLPLILSQFLATFVATVGTTRLGYYMPFVVASVIFLSIGTALITTFHVGIAESRWIGGTIFLSAAENIFNSHLRASVARLQIPGLDAQTAVQVSITNLRRLVPKRYLHDVLIAYSDAVTTALELSLVLGCLTVLGALGMEWKNIKAKQ